MRCAKRKAKDAQIMEQAANTVCSDEIAKMRTPIGFRDARRFCMAGFYNRPFTMWRAVRIAHRHMAHRMLKAYLMCNFFTLPDCGFAWLKRRRGFQ
jgi:hypothetical protein